MPASTNAVDRIRALNRAIKFVVKEAALAATGQDTQQRQSEIDAPDQVAAAGALLGLLGAKMAKENSQAPPRVQIRRKDARQANAGSWLVSEQNDVKKF